MPAGLCNHAQPLVGMQVATTPEEFVAVVGPAGAAVRVAEDIVRVTIDLTSR